MVIFIVDGAGRGPGEARLHDIVLSGRRLRRAHPADRFLNKGNSPIDASLHLRGELLETLRPDRASRLLCCSR